MQDLEQLSKDESDIQWMDMETFANAAGKTQQGISYLINKGRLKEYKDEGVRIKKTDKWYIDASLVELVRTEKPLKTVEEKEALNNQLRSTQTALIKYREFEKRIQVLEADNDKLSQQVQELVCAAEDDRKTLEKALETKKEELSKKIEEIALENAGKLRTFEADKNNLEKLVQELSGELESLRKKRWWKFWE